MKRLTLLFTIAMCAVATFAIPAKPGLRAVQQPDGTTLMVQLIGDEYFHYHATSDGLPLVKNELGAYVYANMLNDRFVATDVMAHDPSMRNAEELHIISQLQPVKMPESSKRLMQQSNGRRAARAQGRRKANGVPGQTKGKHHGLIILVDYPDAKMTHTREEFDAMMNQQDYNQNGCIGSLSDYFSDQSYGQLKIDFDVVGPFTASKSIKYYGENDEDGNDKYAAELVTEAVLMAHEAGTDFSNYDWTGDGYVDQVFVIYAGYAESEHTPDYTIWPHESTLERGNGSISLDGVIVKTYACSSELNDNEGTKINGIGTAAHEFSHCLGLPDFYDATPEHKGAGMGVWSIMDYGPYNHDGYVPCAYTSYERMFCGWMKPVELTEDTRIENMRPITEAPEAYIIYNKGYRNEYYLLENHQQSHNSDTYHAWDKYAYGHGMLVLHVDYDEITWLCNEVNNEPECQGMTIIPANNIFVFKKSKNEVFAGDTYPGSTGNTSLTNISIPSAKLNHLNTDYSALMNAPIEDITEENGGISFHFGSKIITDIPVLGEHTDVDSNGFVAHWEGIDDAISYTLMASDLMESPLHDPVDSILFALDFAEIEPFASATEEGTEEIGEKIEEYLNMEGWEANNAFVAPQSIKIGTPEDGGALFTPTLPEPFGGELTIKVGVAEDNTTTGKLDVDLFDAETLDNLGHGEIDPDGELYGVTMDEIFSKFYIRFRANGEPVNIIYLSAQEVVPPAYNKNEYYKSIEATSFHVTNLVANSLYRYQVKANTLYGSTEWSEPKEVQLGSPVSIADIQNTPAQPRTIYNLQGQRLSKPQRGINIIDGKKVMY